MAARTGKEGGEREGRRREENKEEGKKNKKVMKEVEISLQKGSVTASGVILGRR